LVFGHAPNSFLHPQNIFVSVESSTWHSRPMTLSYSAMTREAYPTELIRLSHHEATRQSNR
jgi:hypothetical protein